MIIDFSTHLVPKSMTKLGIAFPQISGLWNLDERLRLMKKYKVDKQVVTITASIFAGASGAKEVDLCKMANDELSKVQEKHDGKFISLASIPMTAPDEAVEEIERAHHDLGMTGVEMYSNVKGKGLDSKEFNRIYERLVKLDMPIFLHPTNWNWDANHLLDDYGLRIAFGWPFDTAQAMTRIVLGGLFDRYPELKIVTHHLGSMIPTLLGRLVLVNLLDDKVKLKKPLDKEFKCFYGDTAVNCWPLALESGYNFFGAKHIVFGSDYPYGQEGGEFFVRGNLKIMNDLKIPPAEKKLIMESNASKLLKL